MRILLVEDDEILGDGIVVGLRQAGIEVEWNCGAEEGQAALGSGTFSAVILDIGLPGITGLKMLETIRRQGNPIPVMILTSRDTVQDRVTGLNAGADDYLVKPFDLSELIARLHALARRIGGAALGRIRIRDLEIDPAAHTCLKAGVPVDLTRREFAVLKILAEHPGVVLSREKIESVLYAWGDEVESNTIEVHVHHLRRKLGNELIRTARGIGYVIDFP